MKYVSAIMVIAIHSSPFENWNESVYEFIQHISSVAVPFFFAVSGFYFFYNSIGDKKKEKKYLLRLTNVYLVWSAFYAFLAFLKWGYKSISNFIIEMVIGCLFAGTSYHLWFVPALFYAALIYILLSNFVEKRKILFVAVLFSVLGTMFLGLDIGVCFKSKLLSDFIENAIKGLTYFSIGGVFLILQGNTVKKVS